MSSNQRINAFAGLLGGVAQTHALRTVNFDTLEPNEPSVWEGWIGLEAGGSSTFTNASKEYWY